MATPYTLYKIEFAGVVLPEIYFGYDAAKAALKRLEESTIGFGSVRRYDEDTGQLY